MRSSIRTILLLTVVLVLLPSVASAHWGDGDGHLTTAIAEWTIILGGLVGTFYLTFKKKPPKKEVNQEEIQTEV